MKRLIKMFFKSPAIARIMLKAVLSLHTFTYKAASAISPELEPGKLHPKHRIMQYHKWFTARLHSEWHVLDIGCGNGNLTQKMAGACRQVTGIDLNPKNINQAKEVRNGANITFLCADALTFNYDEKVDAFVLSNVLEHIEERVEFLTQIYEKQPRKTPPILLLRVPMITRDWITLYKKELGLEWRLDKTHYTEYTLEQLKSELCLAGLEIETYQIQFGEFYGVIRKPV
ncbi:MAG: class I SAM-dependent methyltransferase [Desulfobacterales bacterium]|nr:class I SAM-dependent methyltransferase [Desulfobacterales bacterium]